MKKVIRYLAVFGAASLLLGGFVSAVERWKEKEKCQNRKIKETEGGEGERMRHCCYGPYEKYVKRPLDFALAFMALFFLSPVLLFVALLVKAKLGSPVIFTQERPGRNEQIFRLRKFRTMTEEKT